MLVLDASLPGLRIVRELDLMCADKGPRVDAILRWSHEA
jgi:hypothetical protein